MSNIRGFVKPKSLTHFLSLHDIHMIINWYTKPAFENICNSRRVTSTQDLFVMSDTTFIRTKTKGPALLKLPSNILKDFA